jgi:hypothetical protein
MFASTAATMREIVIFQIIKFFPRQMLCSIT